MTHLSTWKEKPTPAQSDMSTASYCFNKLVYPQILSVAKPAISTEEAYVCVDFVRWKQMESKPQPQTEPQPAVMLSKPCKVRELEVAARQAVETESVQLHQEDADDFAAIVSQLNQTVVSYFPEGSPQRIFWEQQKKYHQLHDKRQIR